MNYSGVISAVLFLFGCIIGSFLNVCIYRIPRKKSIVSPPSACPDCGEKIKPRDNFPVISFVLLRGKCRACKARISWRYPLVELAAGLLTLLAFLRFDSTYEKIAAIILLYLLLTVVLIDLEFRVIPDGIILTGLTAGTLLQIVSGHMSWKDFSIGIMLGGGILIGAAYLGKLLFRKDSVGGGDIKLGFMLGTYLGYPIILVCMFGAYVYAALISGGSMIFRGKNPAGEIPFAPYIALGAVTGLFFGEKIVQWYKSLMIM